MRWWFVALLLIPSASAMDLYLGYGDQMFLSELQDDPRERHTMAGRGVLGAPLFVTGVGQFLLGDEDPTANTSYPDQVRPLPLVFSSDELHCAPQSGTDMTISLSIIAGGEAWTGRPQDPLQDVYAADFYWNLTAGGDARQGVKERVVGPQDSRFWLNWTVSAPDNMDQPELEVIVQGFTSQMMLGFHNSTGNSKISYQCADVEPVKVPGSANSTAAPAATEPRTSAGEPEESGTPNPVEEKETPWPTWLPLGLLVIAKKMGEMKEGGIPR